MALRLTNAADYAIRSMLYIASLPEDRVVLRSEVADAQNVPSSFLAKILRELSRAGLLRSSRGVHGGFALARPASEISLLDVVEAIEGPMALTACIPDPDNCEYSANCPANAVWVNVQEKIAEALGSANLEMLVSARRRNGRVELHID